MRDYWLLHLGHGDLPSPIGRTYDRGPQHKISWKPLSRHYNCWLLKLNPSCHNSRSAKFYAYAITTAVSVKFPDEWGVWLFFVAPDNYKNPGSAPAIWSLPVNDEEGIRGFNSNPLSSSCIIWTPRDCLLFHLVASASLWCLIDKILVLIIQLSCLRAQYATEGIMFSGRSFSRPPI